MNSHKALVIGGSRTEERSFGMVAAALVAEALRRRGWTVEEIDGGDPRAVVSKIVSLVDTSTIVVPVGYGVGGSEDGQFHTVAALAGVPCAGPTASTGELSVNKLLFQLFVDGLFATAADVTTPGGRLVDVGMDKDQRMDQIRQVRTPMVLKPNFGGSSLGLEVVHSHDEALACANRGLPSVGAILCQGLIAPAEEVSVTILDRAGGPVVLPIVGFKRDGDVFDFEQKFGATANDRHLIPAPIDRRRAERVHQVCLKIHRALGACGLCRFDLLLTAETIAVLECNAIPGLLPTSIASDAAKAAGLSFDELAEAYALSALLPRRQAPLLAAAPING